MSIGGGGIGGAIKNWLVGGDNTKKFDEATNPAYANTVGGFSNAQAGLVGDRRLDFGQANQSRGQMGNLADSLHAVATGTGKGAGEMAVDRQVGQAQAAQQAFARMARGANAALAARQAARSTADLGVAGAGQAAQAQMQDQQGARGQLAGLLGQMRGGDLQTQGLALNQQQANDTAIQGYLQNMMGLDQAQLQRALARQQVASADGGHLATLLQQGGNVGMTYATGGFGGGALLGPAPGQKA